MRNNQMQFKFTAFFLLFVMAGFISAIGAQAGVNELNPYFKYRVLIAEANLLIKQADSSTCYQEPKPPTKAELEAKLKEIEEAKKEIKARLDKEKAKPKDKQDENAIRADEALLVGLDKAIVGLKKAIEKAAACANNSGDDSI